MKTWNTSGVTIVAEYMNAPTKTINLCCSSVEETDPRYTEKVGIDGHLTRSQISKGELLVRGVDLARLPGSLEGNLVRFMDEDTGRSYEIPIYQPQPTPPNTLTLRIR